MCCWEPSTGVLRLSTAVLNPSCLGVLIGSTAVHTQLSTAKHIICTAMLGQSTLILVYEARAGHSSSMGVLLEEQVVYLACVRQARACYSSSTTVLCEQAPFFGTILSSKQGQFNSQSGVNCCIVILTLWGTKPLNKFYQKHAKIT